MAGPAPKDPTQLRRRNAESQWHALDTDAPTRPAPPMLEREKGWSQQTIDWWETIWASPMSLLWLPADMGALHDLCELRERWSHGDMTRGGPNAIRALEDRLGLSPKSRQLLRWQLPRKNPKEPVQPEEVEQPKRQASVSRLRAVDSG